MNLRPIEVRNLAEPRGTSRNLAEPLTPWRNKKMRRLPKGLFKKLIQVSLQRQKCGTSERFAEPCGTSELTRFRRFEQQKTRVFARVRNLLNLFTNTSLYMAKCFYICVVCKYASIGKRFRRFRTTVLFHLTRNTVQPCANYAVHAVWLGCSFLLIILSGVLRAIQL